MIKARAEVQDNNIVKLDFECEGNSYNIMQELICIIAHAIGYMEPTEGATVEDLVKKLPEVVLESMRLNGVLNDAKK